ncbi:ribonuclease P protein subunit p38 [Pygocentrus nattereri]|uniref:ribonuclease P protein subunit p38 n=1 Tax=Pygocentrus nattereri TaxID=42514 RepID=UPI001891C779|nr:ribonuclease P protein subunit p38 [Pygocentrus nattereri]
MATPAQAKKQKKKPIPVKTSLDNPYSLRWTLLRRSENEFILQTLKDRMDTVGLWKNPRKVKDFRSRRKAKKRDSEPAEAENTPRGPGWSDEAVRRQLALGINEVTKGLERDELSLVLVCGSARPAHMTNHLIPLSKTRAVPACQVPGLSASLSGVLGVSSVLALGIRRRTIDFADTVRQIAAKVPPVRVAWMPAVIQLTTAGLEDESLCGKVEKSPAESEEQPRDSQSDPVQTEDSFIDPAEAEDAQSDQIKSKGQKRKLEADDEDPSLSLQPLKVKKTIPNPSKIRKPKKKKKAQKK